MSARIKRHYSLLRWLCTAKPKQARAVIKVADNDLVKAVCECALNLLKGTVAVNKKQKRKLRRYKNLMRKLASKSVSVRSKRALLQKGSGLLGLMIPAAMSVLGQIFK